jgi:hypothetical protein
LELLSQLGVAELVNRYVESPHSLDFGLEVLVLGKALHVRMIRMHEGIPTT